MEKEGKTGFIFASLAGRAIWVSQAIQHNICCLCFAAARLWTRHMAYSASYSFTAVYIHCQHYRLLTSWWRSCSNFPNEKSRLRGCSRLNSNWELKNSVNTFCLPFCSLCFFCLSMLCLCFLCYVLIAASFSFLFQIL